MIVVPNFRRKKREEEKAPPVSDEVVITSVYGVAELDHSAVTEGGEVGSLFGLPIYVTRDASRLGVTVISGTKEVFISDRGLRTIDIGYTMGRAIAKRQNQELLELLREVS